MSTTRTSVAFMFAAMLSLVGCASRRVNPPITQVDPTGGYTFQTRQKHFKSQDTLVVLAFSGGGTRAQRFPMARAGVPATYRGCGTERLEGASVGCGGHDHRRFGGSFTALAYGLYGEKLFADYQQRFLKRDVQGELFARAMRPKYWGDYIGGTSGRSELAANYYDEILFNGATFGDLDRGDGPFIVASATDISTGTRVPFNQTIFNLMCTDLNAVRLARAASASSAVPVVLPAPPSPSTTTAGSCSHEVQPGSRCSPSLAIHRGPQRVRYAS